MSRKAKDHPATQLHTAHLCMERIQNSEQECLHQPPSMVQTFHYHPLRFIKDQMGGQYYVTNEAMQKLPVVYEPLKMNSISRGSSNSTIVAKMH
jgi:hypothetical protein